MRRGHAHTPSLNIVRTASSYQMVEAAKERAVRHEHARVVLCDGRAVVRLGISCVLRTPEIVGELPTSDGLNELLVRVHPSLVMIHTRVAPNGALPVIRALRAQFPQLPVLALADASDPVLAAELLRSGATGIAHVAQSALDLGDAVRTTLRGDRYVSPLLDSSAVDASLRDSSFGTLTRREGEVLSLLAHGHATAAIANRLFISPRTAETHRHRITQKLRTHSASELIRLAMRLESIGWTPATGSGMRARKRGARSPARDRSPEVDARRAHARIHTEGTPI